MASSSSSEAADHGEQMRLRLEQEKADEEYARRLFAEELETPPRRGSRRTRGGGNYSRRQRPSTSSIVVISSSPSASPEPTPSTSSRRGRGRGRGRGRQGTGRTRGTVRNNGASSSGGVGPIRTHGDPEIVADSPAVCRSRVRPLRNSSSRAGGEIQLNGGIRRGDNVVDATHRFSSSSDSPDSDWEEPTMDNPFRFPVLRGTQAWLARQRVTRSRGAAGSNGASSSGGVGPIRTHDEPESSTGSQRRRGRPRALRNNPARRAEGQIQFDGDRVQIRRGDDVIDITNDAHFPNDSDDDDWEEPPEYGRPLSSSRTPSPSPSPPPRSPPPPANIRRHVIDSDFIHQILSNHLNNHVHPDAMHGEIRINFVDDSDSDIEVLEHIGPNELGPIRADRNHINQPIFEEDRQMYNRELDLYHDDDEYRVPPPKVSKGKPVAPDGTWGDCTMCSSTPVKPQGCSKCMQFLGCADCVSRWFRARRGTMEGPSCPLCRAAWPARANVSMMKTIDKNREKAAGKVVKKQEEKKKESVATSSAATSSSSSSLPTTADSDCEEHSMNSPLRT